MMEKAILEDFRKVFPEFYHDGSKTNTLIEMDRHKEIKVTKSLLMHWDLHELISMCHKHELIFDITAKENFVIINIYNGLEHFKRIGRMKPFTFDYNNYDVEVTKKLIINAFNENNITNIAVAKKINYPVLTVNRMLSLSNDVLTKRFIEKCIAAYSFLELIMSIHQDSNDSQLQAKN